MIFLARILICICGFGISLYAYIDRQNELTRLRLQIPVIAQEIKDLKEKNIHLQYEIDLFESPEHLMQLATHSEFSHLRHPLKREVLKISEGFALVAPTEEGETHSVKPKLTLAIGTR